MKLNSPPTTFCVVAVATEARRQKVSALKAQSVFCNVGTTTSPSALACATDIAMDKNKIAAKLRGREFEIEGIDAEGIIHCKQKVIRLRDRSKVEILITSCNVPDNNITCLAHVKQKTYTTVFKPIFEDDSKLVPVKNSGILILHSTFYDNNFIGKNYIYCDGDTEQIIKKKKQKIAAYKIGDEDGNFYFQPDNSFSLLDRAVVRSCVSKLVGKELTVSSANSTEIKRVGHTNSKESKN